MTVALSFTGSVFGHAADGGESTGRGRPRAALDGLGVLDAGLAQMHVHVDEARRHHQPGSVVDIRAAGIEIGAHRGDAAILERQVGYPIEAGGRIDDAAILN